MLSLVFVETLYLNVENAVGIEDDIALRLYILSEFFLVSLLYISELLEEFLIVLELLQLLKLGSVLYELPADGVAEEVCQSRI